MVVEDTPSGLAADATDNSAAGAPRSSAQKAGFALALAKGRFKGALEHTRQRERLASGLLGDDVDAVSAQGDADGIGDTQGAGAGDATDKNTSPNNNNYRENSP